MSSKSLSDALKDVVNFLNNRSYRYALIGGLAVSFRTVERATKDIDFVVAATPDCDSERIIRSFAELGFVVETLLERKRVNNIATVRLLGDEYPGIYLDLLVDATGIENEVVDSSEAIDVLPELSVNIASLASLIALKTLSSVNEQRVQDLIDLKNLIGEANCEELEQAAVLVGLIQDRGYSTEVNLKERYLEFRKRFQGRERA
jgi:predicted nucleotidyltransferase